MSGIGVGKYRKPIIIDQLRAIIRYELLWNFRKKKFIGVLVVAFVFTTLTLVLPVILSNVTGKSIEKNPDYVISNSGIGSLTLFLFALVTVMNSISGEFESGTIVPLLTKPISRTLILAGKTIAALMTISTAYIILYAYMVIGGIAIYGPQNNLNLIPLCILGDLLSTFVWASIVLAISTLTKNTILTTITTIILFLIAWIGTPIISTFTESAWILHYFPGSGANGLLKFGEPPTYVGGTSTGTDSITKMIVQYTLHPSANITYIKIGLGEGPGGIISQKEIYSEPLSTALIRAIFVAVAYIAALTLLTLYTFKRAQILE